MLCSKCKASKVDAKGLCHICYGRERYKLRKDSDRVTKRAYYEANKEKIGKKNKEYNEVHKEELCGKRKEWYENNKDKISVYQYSHRRTPWRRWQSGQYQAKARNIEWNITFEDYVKLINQPCHYCQTSLEKDAGCGLDRRNSSLTYELTNVLPCCGPCNNMRNNFLSVEEMEVAMKAVVEYRYGLKRLNKEK